MMSEGKTIAMQTLEYLGGVPRLQVMIGANNFIFDEKGAVSFKFMKSEYPANKLVLELNGLDLYVMKFVKVHGKREEVVREIDGLFFDQLKEIFEEETGLYLSL